MSKKIGILTQPLHDNYGGLLQAYALKTVLEQQGNNVEIINRRRDTESFKFKLKEIVKRILGRPHKLILTSKQKQLISKNTKYFSNKYIKDITKPIINSEGLKKIAANFDYFVVGSDQVWRPSYSPQISNYYLDFLNGNTPKGVAYAASFGVDTWEYNQDQTTKCKNSIHKFKAISVREDSGVKLCKQHLDTDAIHVVDPTMLLNKQDYLALVNKENEPIIEAELMHYVLDSNKQKEALITKVAGLYDYKIFTCHQKEKVSRESLKNIEDCIFPKVATWLNGFNSAKYIITDSFHGTVFSILFNKPFLVVANNKRGKARFESLLKMFNLNERLVDNVESINVENLKPINWDEVNSILQDQKKFALDFLKCNLV